MSAQHGKPSTRGPITPAKVAGQLGLRWSDPGKSGTGMMTWDMLLDLAAVAYWQRRKNPVTSPMNSPRPVSSRTLAT